MPLETTYMVDQLASDRPTQKRLRRCDMSFEISQQAHYERAQVAAAYDEQDGAKRLANSGKRDGDGVTLAIFAAIFVCIYVALHVWNVVTVWAGSLWPF